MAKEDTFDRTDNEVKRTFQDWQSDGSLMTEDEYNQFRQNYERFYTNVQVMYNSVMSITDRSEETEIDRGSSILG